MSNRVNYFERQFLRMQDFQDEQSYHIAMRRRHNIAHHTWGIVRGLELLFDEESQQFFVQPGIAIDGYGRELLLPERLQISSRVFDDLDSERLDVNLYYGRVESDPPPRGYVECDNDGFYRSQERVYMRLSPSQPDSDPRSPRTVPAGDLDFNPARMPPDSPLNEWPVFVGQLVRDLQENLSVVTVGRPYAGLVGEDIQTPSRLSRLLVGDTPDPDKPNSRRFAVFLSLGELDDLCQPQPVDQPSQLEIVTEKLLDDEGQERYTTQVDIRGETTIHGNVNIIAGALRVEAEAPAPDYPQPWRVYRVENANEHEMRIEMSNATNSQVVIGAWSAKEKKFKPCLTVTNNCEVIIHGKLIAGNFLKRVPPSSGGTAVAEAVAPSGEARIYSAGLSPEAKSAVSGMLMTGIASAIHRPYALARQGDAQPSGIPIVQAQTVPSGAEILVNVVQMDESELESLLKGVYDSRPDLVEKIRTLRDTMTRTLRRRTSGEG